MAYLRRKYYYRDDDIPKGLKALYAGFSILEEHPLFSQLEGTITPKTSHLSGKESIACVTKSGEIFVNIAANLDANECSRRVKLLEDLERNLEGFSYSVKTVMQGSKDGLLKGIHGPVSRVFEVPEDSKDYSISYLEQFSNDTEGDVFFVYFTAKDK